MAPDTTTTSGTRKRDESPEFTIDYEEQRPRVLQYKEASESAQLRPGDKVWYRAMANSPPEGPFKISKPTSPGKYILCLAEDVTIPAKEGREIDGKRLERVPE